MKKNSFYTMLIVILSSVFIQNTFAQPVNDSCSTPTVITSNDTCILEDGTVNGATPTSGLAQGTCDNYSGTYAGEDVWYSFTAQYASNSIQVKHRGGSNIDAILVLYSGTCGNLVELDCDDTPLSGEATINYSNFVVGQTYLIRVYGYGSQSPSNGDFSICIQHAASGANVDIEYLNHTTSDGINGNGSGDSDGLGEPGESVMLSVALTNNGSTTAHNISGNLTCSDADITFTSNSGNWADIDPGDSQVSNDFIFSIANGTNEKDIVISLTINTDEGTYTDSFLYHIYNGIVSVHQDNLLIDDSNGNMNAQLDPGENISLEIKFHNGGNSIAHNVSGVLSTNDGDITFSNNTVNVGDIAGDADIWAQSYTFDIAAGAPEKDVIFTLTISSNEGSWIDQFTLHINDPAALNSIDNKEIKIFPNPANQYINITTQNDNIELQKIEILNLTGQLMIQKGNIEQINISSLKNDLYIMKITDKNDRVEYFKFIKK